MHILIKVDEKDEVKMFNLMLEYTHSRMRGNIYRLEEKEDEILEKMDKLEINYKIL